MLDDELNRAFDIYSDKRIDRITKVQKLAYRIIAKATQIFGLRGFFFSLCSTTRISFERAGKAFGEEELHDAIRRGAIVILDEQTIADMKAKRARDKARDQARQEAEAIASGEVTDWKEAMKEWEAQMENQQ